MAIRINRVYTQVGDKGKTQIVDGSFVSKNHNLIHLYGSFDELNVQLGFLRMYLESDSQKQKLHNWITLLKKIQNNLFDLGYVITDDKHQGVISLKDIKELEAMMDKTVLPELKSFVLTGGSLLNCQSHLCRVICRRVERQVVAWSESNPMHEIYLAYINRLSDVFFVLARYSLKLHEKPECLWGNGYVE